MYTGSGCEAEVRAKSLTEAATEGSVLPVSKFGTASNQPNSRQKQVRLK